MAPRVVRLAILDTYGVSWSREAFARDLLQNFFDAAPDFRDVVLDIRPDAGTVEIRGPVGFDIDLLAYIGATTKTTGKTAGGFGEGFKICALIGARDLGLTMTAGAGADELEVFLDPVPLGRELCYRVTRAADGRKRAGAFVHLGGCDAACIAAFQAAPGMFRHPLNPKLGQPIVEDAAQGVAAYRSPEHRAGEIYYRRQLRGRTSFYSSGPEAPVTLAHDGIIDEIEGDRDRRDLPARPIARAVGEKLAPEPLYALLLHLMPYWRHGAEVLAGLIEAAAKRELRFDFPAGWLARTSKGRALDAFAERQGLRLALAAFAAIGMRTAAEHYQELETRPADPLERARIQVVADLYAELAGHPARVKEFEVFDDPRAAVMGQHLGSKVIMDARLLRRGFDHVAGTILHELSHEAGGEEDPRFLRRLQRVLGAAIREPERVRAARRRFARAEPAPPEPPPPASAYAPEHSHFDYDDHGIACTLVVPPAFPPTEALLAALRSAAADVGVGLRIFGEAVTGPIGAASWMAPGVPTLWIGDADADPADPAAPLGYRLRTYGPDGARLVPDPEALRAALRRAAERGFKGRRGFEARFSIHEAGKRRAEELFGVRFPATPAPKPPSARDRRDNAVIKELEGYSGSPSIDLGGLWSAGIMNGGLALLKRYARSRRGAGAVWPEIKAALGKAIGCSRELRRADPDFDDADDLERDAMGAAQGAAVAAFAEERDEAAARARAERSFRAVRAATARVLDLNVALEVKPAILEHALRCSGLDDGEPGGIDLAEFDRVLEGAIATTLAMQREADEEGLFLRGSSVIMPFMKAQLARRYEPRGVRARAKERARAERAAERAAARSAATQAIRRAYEDALSATGSATLAAARCLEEAARLLPEEAP